MSWNVVRLADVPPTPWRNGGGITRELAVGPTPGAWVWRMSVADVARGGPFSQFDGITRWFAVMAGAGVHLDVDGKQHRMTVLDAPLQFDGGATTQCTLIDGATQDFNLMVRSAVGSAQMERIQGRFGTRLNAPKIIAAYAIDTGASVHFGSEELALEPQTLAWRRSPNHATVGVTSANALWMEISV